MAIAVAIAMGVCGPAACHRYTPVTVAQSSTLAADTPVRVELTDAAAAALAPLVGTGVVAIDGWVRGFTADTMQLAVTGTVQRSGATQSWIGEELRLPVAGISQTRLRQKDVARSVLVGAGIAAGAILAARIAGIDFSLRGTNRGGTRPQR